MKVRSPRFTQRNRRRTTPSTPLILITYSNKHSSVTLSTIYQVIYTDLNLQYNTIVISRNLRSNSSQITALATRQYHSYNLTPITIHATDIRIRNRNIRTTTHRTQCKRLYSTTHRLGTTIILLTRALSSRTRAILVKLLHDNNISTLTNVPRMVRHSNVVFLEPLVNISQTRAANVYRSLGVRC